MTRSKSNVSDPFALALRWLTGRDRSTAELRRKLDAAGFSAEAVEETLERCRSCGYLDDHRFALERARALLRSGRGCGRKILHDLHQHGIADSQAVDALATAETEYPPEQMLRDQLRRRFPRYSEDRADDRERRRVVAYFQRRGFTVGQILQILRDHDSSPAN